MSWSSIGGEVTAAFGDASLRPEVHAGLRMGKGPSQNKWMTGSGALTLEAVRVT